MEIYKKNLFVEMYSEHEGHLHGFKRVLVEGRTDFQLVEIVDTHAYGRCLLLDGKMQSSQMDEFLYHELLVHPALIAHPRPRRVLVIGGGEGATLREVLRYPSVEHVDMIEIDAKVLDFARLHLREWHQGSFDDPRVRLVVGDGRRFVEKSTDRYDAVIIDVSDPGFEGPATFMYTLQFYRAVADHLSPQGVIAMQAGSSSIVEGEIMASIHETLQLVFPMVLGYEAFIPSFDLPWGFCIGSTDLDPRALTAAEVDQRLAVRRLTELRAYDGETHIGLFARSKALRNTLATQGRVIEDQQPIYTPL